MAWIYLTIAGVMEILWAFFMKRSDGFSKLTPSVLTIVCMGFSVWLLALSMRQLPLGTAYTIWTGIGAAGAFLVGILFLGESIGTLRVLAAVLIISGVVLMQLASAH